MNIIWLQPNNTLAVTSIFDGSDPAEHAQLLQSRGDIPLDWQLLATGVQYFPPWPRQEDWIFDATSGITVDMDRAKASTKNRLRVERAPLFTPLDVQYQRNQETGTDNSTIVAEKQRLRDITKLVDPCTTLDELLVLECK